jgi:hypothetical protein
MLKYGQRYVEKGTEYQENSYRPQQIHVLQRKAATTAIKAVESFLLPISPLLLTVIPMEDLVMKLIKAFMG